MNNHLEIPFFKPSEINLLFKCFDGNVTVAHINSLTFHPVTLEIFEKAESYIKLWSSIYNSFHHYVRYIIPFESELYPDNPFLSSSGCFMEEYGLIHCTHRHSFCLAEAMVHEMAHMKLFSMGINYEHATAIITNSPTEKYYSPVKECERPMTAVFHAVYSFIHILHLNNLIIKHDTGNNDIPTFLLMAKDTLCKMREGCELVTKNIKTDQQGKLFVSDFLSWAEATMSETEKILNTYGTKR
jgi:hypothetical protein